MKYTINFNEMRRLSKRHAKSRPILHTLYINNDCAYWTDTAFLLRLAGYDKTPDGIYDLDNLKVPHGEYPRLDTIINRPRTMDKPTYQAMFYIDNFVYYYTNEKGERYGISENNIKIVEKLIKGYKFNLNDLTIHGVNFHLELNDGEILLIFTPIRIRDN